MSQDEIVCSKAMAMKGSGSLQEARSLLDDHVRISPASPSLLRLLGEICGLQLDHVSSIRYLEAANTLEPGNMESGFMLGVEYFLTGRYSESLSTMEQLIKAFPGVSTLHDFRGLALREMGQFPEAEAAFREALCHDPLSVWPMVNLANLLVKLCRFDEAEPLLVKALESQPGLAAAHNDLGRLYQKQGRISCAAGHFRRILELEPANRIAASNLLYSLCYSDKIFPEAIAEEHFAIAKRLYPWKHTGKQDLLPRSTASKLRIGYISSDLCEHSVSFFIEPVLVNHDSHRFEIFCYSNRNVPDETTMRLRSLNLTWRDIYGIGPAEVAQMIAADRIDILVDLSGHTAHNRLDVCALKPAPIMCTWLGYPHSTGMGQFDYYISDAICDPPRLVEHLYSEQLWRLPDLFCCYLPPVEFPPIAPPPYQQVGSITFGSFNNVAKVSDTVISAWTDILLQVSGSRLLLKSASLGGASIQQHLKERFSVHGVQPERIQFMAHTPTTLEHLAQYARVDIALDSYPYHGTTTTCEALWMGVPVVTLAGRTHLSRVGASIMANINLEELVTTTIEEYVSHAVGLANDKERLLDLRCGLRGKMSSSPLMDYAGMTRKLEEAYYAMIGKGQ